MDLLTRFLWKILSVTTRNPTLPSILLNFLVNFSKISLMESFFEPFEIPTVEIFVNMSEYAWLSIFLEKQNRFWYYHLRTYFFDDLLKFTKFFSKFSIFFAKIMFYTMKMLLDGSKNITNRSGMIFLIYLVLRNFSQLLQSSEIQDFQNSMYHWFTKILVNTTFQKFQNLVSQSSGGVGKSSAALCQLKK